MSSLAANAQARELVLPVPRVTVYPGTAITQDMLAMRGFKGKDYEHPGYVQTGDALIGKIARKTLLPNVPVATIGVREPFSITQGQPTVVVFSSNGLVISGFAIPLQNASAGEIVSLRNTESGITIRGIVQPNGTVRIGMP